MLKAALQKLNALPREGRDTLFLLAVIGWVVMPQVGNLPWWCSGLAAGVLLWRGRLAWTSRPLPGRWWIAGLLALTIGATLLTHRTLMGRDAGVTLIVVLFALKTLELRARRDAFVIFFLGFFTMLTNFFFSQSLLTAAAMLVALLGLLTALVNAHMPVGKPPLMQAARTAGTMVLVGAPIMVVLFLLFPRLAPLWGIPSDAMTGRSGLSSTMQVGNIASLALDESIALRIKFDGPAPAQQDMYFRGPVLTRFDGREWQPLQPRLAQRFSAGVLGSPNLDVGGVPVRRWQFYSETDATDEEWSYGVNGWHKAGIDPHWFGKRASDGSSVATTWFEDGEQHLIYNESDDKLNWMPLSFTIDLQRKAYDSLRVGHRTFTFPQDARPTLAPPYRDIEALLNPVFFVEADTARRVSLYLDSVQISIEEAP